MRSCSAAALTLIVVFVISGCQQSDPNQSFLHTYATEVATPAYETLLLEANRLSTATDLCATPLPETFTTNSQRYWRSTMMAWQAAKPIRFGAVIDQRIDWEFQFWPDKKNLVARKTAPLLKQATPLSSEQLANSSVVLHGLSALELLLFDPATIDSANPERYCELTQWIGKNIATNAKLLDSGWALLQPEFIAPSEQSDEFGSLKIATAKLLDGYRVTLEELGRQKIGEAIGDTTNTRANPYFLESWRSQHSWQNISANLASMNKLFVAGGLSVYLKELGLLEVNNKLQQQLDLLNSAAKKINPPLFTSLEEQTKNLRDLQQLAQDLSLLLNKDIIEVLDLPSGFNDQDGD